jgi:hypothetical protein
LSYSFKDKNRLAFSENGGTSVEAGYGALTLKQMVFFSHMAPKILKGYNVFVDLDSNLVTVFEVWFCGSKDSQGQVLDDREVQRQFYFGYVEVAGKEAPKARHHTTNRIEGKGMYWKQDTGIETCIAINEKTMRVCGFKYEGGSRGVDLTVVGAIASPIGCYDVKHFFGPKTKVKGA